MMKKHFFLLSCILTIFLSLSGKADSSSVVLNPHHVHEALEALEKDRKIFDNREMKKLAFMLKRACDLQAYFDGEETPMKLRRAGDSLRPFYYSRRMVSAALANDLKVYKYQPCDVTLCNVIESLVLLGRHSEALRFCKEISPRDRLSSLILNGALVYAKLGNQDAAGDLLKRLDMKKCSAPELYIWLQIATIQKNVKLASHIVKRILINAPPDESESLKEQFRSGEFEKIAQEPEYKEALMTLTEAFRGQGQSPNAGTIREEKR